MSLAFLVPVLNRPHRVRLLLESIDAATPVDWVACFALDVDDHAEREMIESLDGQYPIRWFEQARRTISDDPPNYASKINEAAARMEAHDLLFLGADDLKFHPGWFDAAVSRMADNDVQVVGTNDLCNARTFGAPYDHSTHSLVRSSYINMGTIDHPGKLLHEGYLHEFVDDEFIKTAQWRGVYRHAPDSIVEHLHPMAGKAPMDDLYAMTHARMRVGRRLYQRREQLWSQTA